MNDNEDNYYIEEDDDEDNEHKLNGSYDKLKD